MLLFVLSTSVFAASVEEYLAVSKQHYSAGKYQDMMDVLMQGVEEYPDSPELFYDLGLAYVKAGREKLAVRSYERAVQLKPGLSEARMALASIYLQNKQYKKAMEHFKVLQKTNSTDPELAEKLALLYFYQKNYSEAIRYFNKAIELDPARTGTDSNYLGMVYFMQGDKKAALESLNRARALGVLTEDGQRLASLLAMDAQSYDEALSLINDLIQSGKATADDYTNAGTAYYRKGDVESSLSMYQRSLSMQPKQSAVLQNVAVAYMALEDQDSAAKVWKKYLVLKPDDAEAWFSYGVCLEGIGAVSQAQQAYTKAKAKGYTDTVQVEKAIERTQSRSVTPNNG